MGPVGSAVLICNQVSFQQKIAFCPFSELRSKDESSRNGSLWPLQGLKLVSEDFNLFHSQKMASEWL